MKKQLNELKKGDRVVIKYSDGVERFHIAGDTQIIEQVQPDKTITAIRVNHSNYDIETGGCVSPSGDSIIIPCEQETIPEQGDELFFKISLPGKDVIEIFSKTEHEKSDMPWPKTWFTPSIYVNGNKQTEFESKVFEVSGCSHGRAHGMQLLYKHCFDYVTTILI